MGEVKIKSGNLFDINGKYSAYMHQGSPTCRVDNGQIIVNVVPYYFAHIKFSALIPSGQYTIKYKASANFRATRLLLTKPFDTGTWNESYKCYYADMVKNDNYYTYTFTVDEDFAIGFAISGTTGDTGTIDEIMLNEGTTALPFQPYFLNLPAHQYVNGEWIDIPTHKYTNNRWQGELTSQSPLKFRADGEMLDWRVEGKTSGNLVESFRTTEYTEQYRICLLGKLNIKPSTSYTISFIMEEGAKAYFSEYIFTFKNFTGTGQRQVINITTKANIDKNASTWTDEYGWILCKNMNNNEKPCNFREVMILEGIYTSETIPPYEPYGGVGDWDETEQKYVVPVTVNGTTTNIFTDHQLMDGDSIDYATDQTAIPIAIGNNTLTVDTAVQPSKVFVKFEG